MKKVIAFDLDGTLAPSKSPLPDRMGELLRELLIHKEVCVISGGKFEQFEVQLINNLQAEPKLLARLHIMPTCGTRYFRFNEKTGHWNQLYAEDIPDEDKKRIIDALDEGVTKLGLKSDKFWGEMIEDRGSQITLSALGQEAPIEEKEAWDPDGSKKKKIRDYVAELIPEYEVRAGGTTSIDVTRQGIDKAYGMRKLMEATSVSMDEILFIGDRLAEGGNDYPVKAMGIDSIQISHWQETALVVDAIVKSA